MSRGGGDGDGAGDGVLYGGFGDAECNRIGDKKRSGSQCASLTAAFVGAARPEHG